MALNRENLFALAVQVAKGNPSTTFSYGETKLTYAAAEETLRNELRELAKDYATYRENKNTIFALVEKVLTETLPVDVKAQYGMFAEISTIGQGDKAVFVERITEDAKRRAKKNFVTKVGLAGRYEVFMLDGRTVTVQTTAYGGAARIGLEEFLDGRFTFDEFISLIREGMSDAVYTEIIKALDSIVAGIRTKNICFESETAFVEASMDELLAKADSMGGKATIFCTYKFAATMVPQTGWVSNEMKNTKWAQGYLGSYKGHNVVVLSQSYTDEKFSTTVLNDQIAYIIPSGAEKPIKIVFEGQTQVREVEDNDDWSRYFQTYQKFGVAIVGLNAGFGIYENTSL